MTQIHYSSQLHLCLRVKDLLVNLQLFIYSFLKCCHSVSSFFAFIQHRVVGISGDLEESFFHLASQSCIQTLSIVLGLLKSAMEKVRKLSKFKNRK